MCHRGEHAHFITSATCRPNKVPVVSLKALYRPCSRPHRAGWRAREVDFRHSAVLAWAGCHTQPAGMPMLGRKSNAKVNSTVCACPRVSLHLECSLALTGVAVGDPPPYSHDRVAPLPEGQNPDCESKRGICLYPLSPPMATQAQIRQKKKATKTVRLDSSLTAVCIVWLRCYFRQSGMFVISTAVGLHYTMRW